MNEPLTIRDLAEAAVKAGTCPPTYDFALPQPWVDRVHDYTGYWPQELGVVWGYWPHETWGHAVPLTINAAIVLERYETLRAVEELTGYTFRQMQALKDQRREYGRSPAKKEVAA